MTNVSEVENDSKYFRVLDHGFVGLVDYMGSDEDICSAARVSYGKGTKKTSEDRSLIRYLIRHKHTSPLEMCEIKLHCKLPIFVARQVIRHRTGSFNEYSARYSELTDEFYLPEKENLKTQSFTNKQGRGNSISFNVASEMQVALDTSYECSWKIYQALLGNDLSYLKKGGGLARELARIALPLATYTEWYWKTDLHNLFHFLKLRTDSHAQYETRMYADAIEKLIAPLFPIAHEAWVDYSKEAHNFSRMEMNFIRDTLISLGATRENISEVLASSSWGLSKRETTELIDILFPNSVE